MYRAPPCACSRALPTALLLASGAVGSVLDSYGAGQHERLGYCPYGNPRPRAATRARTGFNGQLREPQGWYHLGNGHRVYNPALRRFHSADRLSPFDEGGLNAYAYCLGDPVNFTDPTGRIVQEAHIASFMLQTVTFLTAAIALTVPALALKGGLFGALARHGAPLTKALTNSERVASTIALFSSTSGITSTALQTQDPPLIGTQLMWAMVGLSLSVALVGVGAGFVPATGLTKGTKAYRFARAVHGKRHLSDIRPAVGTVRRGSASSAATNGAMADVQQVVASPPPLPMQPAPASFASLPSRPPLPAVSERVRRFGEAQRVVMSRRDGQWRVDIEAYV